MILFESISAQPVDDSGRVAMRMRVSGVDIGDTTGLDFGTVSMTLAANGEDEHVGELVINIPDVGAGALVLGASGADGGLTADSGRASMLADVSGFDLVPGQDAGGVTLRLGVRAFENPPVRAYANLIAPAPAMLAYGGLQYDRVAEVLAAGALTAEQVTAALLGRVGVAAAPGLTLTALARVRDQIDLGEALAFIARELAADGFDIGASGTTNYTAITRVADALRLTGVARSTLEAMNLVVAGIAFRSMAEIFAKEQVREGFDIGAAVDDTLRAAAKLVEQALLGGEIQNSMRFGALVHESIRLSAGITGAAELLARIREGVELALHLNVEGEQATAYVLNTELGANGATTYQNYPFNSFARVGGEHGEQYGMTPDGIRRIGGQTDGGAPINAAVRLAMGNLGTGVAKRMQAAYLGYASNGDIRLKAIVVGRDGQREAWCYRMVDMPGEDTQQARIQIGQGLKSVYWGFGLESIDGSAFTVDLLDLHPLVLDQRMLGQGGGRR